jgi:tetratricopeptide (TPR) repeat protein
MFHRFLTVGVVLALALTPAVARAQEHQHGAQPAERLGKVHFENSCDASVRDSFDRAVALLHSFWYAAAIDAFNDVAKKDPSCGIAHWGVAMAVWGNPLGGTRTPQILARGRESVALAKKAGAKTPREQDYIAAVDALYAGEGDQLSHARAYEKAMESVVAKYPKDTEAMVFYAIALDAAADPADKTYAKQLQAGKMLEKVLATQPDHPGVSHYLIHSYDYPALAAKGLPAARRYAQIAPDAPHALHMPSHIFTRVGAWQDSIASNMASAAAAKKANSPAEELHAMDYQTYAYLQLGRDTDAMKVQSETEPTLARVEAGSGYNFAAVYAATAIPARVALERGAWKDAANLKTRSTAFPHGDAVATFARILGEARSGQAAAARKDLATLAPVPEALKAKNEPYWSNQVAIQLKAAEGWTLHAEGKTAEGIALLRQAADQEDASEKSPVTPGPIAPARELLAELLLEAKQPKEALAEFEKSMTREPGRFRSIAGAMQAAHAAGDTVKAKKYAGELLTLAKTAAPGRPEISEAQKYAK